MDDGFNDGFRDGTLDGNPVGIFDGKAVGNNDGIIVGNTDGNNDGNDVGAPVGGFSHNPQLNGQTSLALKRITSPLCVDNSTFCTHFVSVAFIMSSQSKPSFSFI